MIIQHHCINLIIQNIFLTNGSYDGITDKSFDIIHHKEADKEN